MRNLIQSMCRYIVFLGVIALPSVVIAAPKTPTGASPGSLTGPGQSLASNSVTLKWNTIPTTTYYNVGVRDIISNQLVVSATSTSASYTANLQSGRQYRWNVAACNASGCSAYTNLLYFQTPAPPTPTYSVTVTKVGSGTITGSGINCGATCTTSASSRSNIVLNAVAGTGYTFSGWSGIPGCSTSVACNFSLNGSKAVTATFVQQQVVEYPLTVSTTGSGVVTGSGISCGTKCSGSFKSGTVVVLTAAPTTGFTFAGWGGNAGCSGTQACSVSITAAKSVTATFTAVVPSYNLMISKNGNGSVTGSGINCGTGCTSSIKSGTVVTLQAAPGSDSVFSGWTGAAGCNNTPSCTFTMSESKSIAANFTLKQVNYTLSVSKTGNGTVSGTGINCGSSCSSTQQKGTSISLKAVASPGSIFLQWSGDCTGSSDTCTLSLQSNKSAQALFAPIIDSARLRMSTTTKHVGVHMWLYNKSEEEIRSSIRALKAGMFSDSNAATFKARDGKTAQFSVQLEVSLKSYVHDTSDVFWRKLTQAVNVLYSEGVVTHLLISAHDLPEQEFINLDHLPDPRDKWLLRDWTSKKWMNSTVFVPYMPCRSRSIAGELCTYDEIFENFHKTVIERLVQEKIADRLAVIYVLNEFDYQGRADLDATPKFSPWTDVRCGTQPNKEICRAEAIAYTTRRAIEIATKAAAQKVPVGIKLPWFTPQGKMSAFNPVIVGGTVADQFSYLLREVLEPNKAVLGYDCYSPWPTWFNEMYCKSDYERIKAVLPERRLQDSLQNGRFVLTEYAAYCKGSPNSFIEGLRTTSSEMESFVNNFPLASGFNLFAFNATGVADGCYALANPANLVIYPGALRSGSTIPGLGKQFDAVLGR